MNRRRLLRRPGAYTRYAVCEEFMSHAQDRRVKVAVHLALLCRDCIVSVDTNLLGLRDARNNHTYRQCCRIDMVEMTVVCGRLNPNIVTLNKTETLKVLTIAAHPPAMAHPILWVDQCTPSESQN